jgi:hypothetical protein
MTPRSVVLAVAVLAVGATHAAAATCERLDPLVLKHLTGRDYSRTRDIAWVDDGRVAIATSSGLRLLTIRDASSRLLPANIREVLRVASDGRTIVASNAEFADVAVDVVSGKTIHERQKFGMRVNDVAVRGTTLAVLGFPVRVDGVDFGNLWKGAVGAPWESFELLRPTPNSHLDYVKSTFPLYAGAVAIASDGGVWSITPGEPGVVRYDANGRSLRSLGSRLTELVVPNLKDVMTKYAMDPLARYTEVLNRQPIVDDLILLPEGPAIVVRRFNQGTVSWELWFAGPEATRRRVRLAIDQKQIAGGHLRCDARGMMIACVFGKLLKVGQPEEPYLTVFDLSTVKRSSGCK